MWLVYATQTLTFGGGLLGITYGALSASWDPVSVDCRPFDACVTAR